LRAACRLLPSSVVLNAMALGLILLFVVSYLLRRTSAWWVTGALMLGLAGVLLVAVGAESGGSHHDDPWYGIGVFIELAGAGLASLIGVSLLVFTSSARKRATRNEAPALELPVATVVQR
jgi:hypothetical protein